MSEQTKKKGRKEGGKKKKKKLTMNSFISGVLFAPYESCELSLKSYLSAFTFLSALLSTNKSQPSTLLSCPYEV